MSRGEEGYGTEEKNTKRFLHFFGSREDYPRRRGPLNCRSRPTLPFPIGRCTVQHTKERKGKKKKNTSFPSLLCIFKVRRRRRRYNTSAFAVLYFLQKNLNLFSCSCGKWAKGEGAPLCPSLLPPFHCYYCPPPPSFAKRICQVVFSFRLPLWGREVGSNNGGDREARKSE